MILEFTWLLCTRHYQARPLLCENDLKPNMVNLGTEFAVFDQFVGDSRANAFS